MPRLRIGNRLSHLPIVAVAVLLAVGASLILGVVVIRNRGLQAESSAFVNHVVADFANGWDTERLRKQSTPTLRARLNPQILRAMAAEAAVLGPFGADLGVTIKTRIPFFAGFGGIASTSYVARARYLNGLATFHIEVLQYDGRWMIEHFRADAALLGPPGPDFVRTLSFGAQP